MQNTDPRMRNYKNLDEQRRDNEMERAKINNRVMMRIVVVVIALFMILSSYPSLFLGFLLILPVLLAAGVGIFVYVRKKRQENETDSPVTALFDFISQNIRTDRNAQEYQTIAENNYDYCSTVSEHDHVSSSSYTANNSKIVDSWDIKDAKPPWEL